jgi:transcription-repair coupling factor (superfamily II helicase)
VQHSILTPPVPTEKNNHIGWSGLKGCAESLAIVQAAKTSRYPTIIVTRDARRLTIMETELRFFADINDVPISVFPDWECLPYDFFSPHQDIISERLRVLASLPESGTGILLISAANLMQRLPPIDYVLGQTVDLKVGQRIDIDEFRRRLQQSAYYSVSQVAIPGEYAVRGGLVDLFPMGSELPIRIDLFDDQIDSLRQFDPENQLSTAKLDHVSLLPAREFPMHEEAIKTFRQNFRKRFDGDPMKQPVYAEISNGNTIAGIEFFFPLFFDHTDTLFSYVSKQAHWVCDHGLLDESARFHAEVVDRFENCRLDPDRRVLPPDSIYLKSGELEHQLSERPVIRLHQDESNRTLKFDTLVGENPVVEPRSEFPYKNLVNILNTSKYRILLAVETVGRREALESVLIGHELITTAVTDWHDFLSDNNNELGIVVAGIERGTSFPELNIQVITETQLYGDKVFQRRRRSGRNRDPETIIKSLAELQIDDPVVHENHGIGRYMGLVTLGIAGEENEFLLIRYKGTDKLYVPILSLDRVSRYLGGDTDSAPLHKLGSDVWQKAQKKARQKAYDIAAELLELAALRESRVGQSMPIPVEAYRDFRDRFPFEETPDQNQVIEEVLNDLADKKPMDRLVCGDVGFGKTEVALRAAFVAVHNKQQVAMLVPTTLLAQQHFQTFQDRFADLPIEVELISRFRSKKDVEKLVASLQNGYPDIVVGTHRLLQPDIKFKNLGLLIIDEEHRFGVRQKEQLKKLRSEVDILTLSATPIPRTLNMAMAGMRGISIIATPPVDRLSIKTFIRPFNNALIREAILRETHRGGQVYFLHNEVKSIEWMRDQLMDIVPEAKIEVGHGQMGGAELERTMRDFYHQKFNVLLCTTIVESGIDIPTANTIIINRADRFGLAQLHQLRGRVGRSHHQAFAYLLVPDASAITADAKKRLDAFESMENLGAGFTLASHDLEIRGAGELLGESQSGTIDTVGFTLFSDYLNRAVEELTRHKERAEGKEPTLQLPVRAADVQFGCTALLPSDFVPDVHVRLVLYKRIAAAIDSVALRELQVEIIDRFGLLPDPAKKLFEVTGLSHRAGKLGIEKISFTGESGSLNFSNDNRVEPENIIRLIQSKPGKYRMAGAFILNVTKLGEDVEERIVACDEILRLLEVNIND